MKKIYLAAFVVVMASCSKENAQDINGLEIKLQGAVTEVTSRAVVGVSDNFTASVAAWESSTTVDYTIGTKWQTSSNVSGEGASATLILATPQYYNADNAIKSYVKAWYPAGIPVSGFVAIANTTGNVDVMYADEISGSKWTNISTPLTFNHLTSQLKFEVVAGTGLATGTTLTSIKVKNVQIPTSLNIETGELGAAAATDYMVQGISNDAIGEFALSVGDPFMILPRTTTGLVLDVITSTATFTDVPITIDTDANLLPGRVYTVELTFKQVAIELTTTVTSWTNGTGTGEVE